jgi:hypothetical protein
MATKSQIGSVQSAVSSRRGMSAKSRERAMRENKESQLQQTPVKEVSALNMSITLNGGGGDQTNAGTMG